MILRILHVRGSSLAVPLRYCSRGERLGLYQKSEIPDLVSLRSLRLSGAQNFSRRDVEIVEWQLCPSRTKREVLELCRDFSDELL